MWPHSKGRVVGGKALNECGVEWANLKVSVTLQSFLINTLS